MSPALLPVPEDEKTSGAAIADPEGAEDPRHDLIGHVIAGRYRITGVIGHGGMGVVYGALHLELEQPVAIKILPATFARDAETLKRFEQEAKTASRVKHANVVQVFDLGRLSSGEPYLAMELLHGSDLESKMETGRRFSETEILDVLAPMAAALDALHKEQVVHRDVKPSNVFFARNSSGGETIKLVDFGLATLTAAGEGAERLTRVGHVVGTAVYMPPESARGALCEPAGDIYSLAVMAFELLAGAPPFDGQPMAVLMDKVSQRAPSLTTIGKRRYGPTVEALFASALDREPARRPRTAMDFVERLRLALASEQSGSGLDREPTGARTTVRPERSPAGDAELPTQRRPALIAGLCVLALLLSGGAYFALRAPTPSATPLPPAPLPHAPIAPAEAPIAIDVPEEIPVGIAPEAAPIAEPTPVAASRPSPRPRPAAVPDEPETPAVVRAPEPPPPTGSTDRSSSLVRDASSAMLRGEIPRARDLYREATLAAPRNAAAWRGLGLASERLHLVPEARTAYERYLELAPTAGDAATVRDRLTRLGR